MCNIYLLLCSQGRRTLGRQNAAPGSHDGCWLRHVAQHVEKRRLRRRHRLLLQSRNDEVLLVRHAAQEQKKDIKQQTTQWGCSDCV